MTTRSTRNLKIDTNDKCVDTETNDTIINLTKSELRNIIKECNADLLTELNQLKTDFANRLDFLQRELQTKINEKSSETATLLLSLESRLEKTERASSINKKSVPEKENANVKITNVVDILEEFSTKNEKKENIVIQGIEEQNQGNWEARKDADKAAYVSICTALDIDSTTCSNVFRLGKKADGNARPRPLLVKCGSSVKSALFSKCKHLRKLDGDKFLNVYLQPDLSRQEQERNKKLRDELRARKANGESDIYIRNGVIEKTKNHRDKKD